MFRYFSAGRRMMSTGPAGESKEKYVYLAPAIYFGYGILFSIIQADNARISANQYTRIQINSLEERINKKLEEETSARRSH